MEYRDKHEKRLTLIDDALCKASVSGDVIEKVLELVDKELDLAYQRGMSDGFIYMAKIAPMPKKGIKNEA